MRETALSYQAVYKFYSERLEALIALKNLPEPPYQYQRLYNLLNSRIYNFYCNFEQFLSNFGIANEVISTKEAIDFCIFMKLRRIEHLENLRLACAPERKYTVEEDAMKMRSIVEKIIGDSNRKLVFAQLLWKQEMSFITQFGDLSVI